MVEGPSKRDPTVVTGRTRQNKLVHFRLPVRAGPPGPTPRWPSPPPPPTTCGGSSSRSPPGRRPGPASPCRPVGRRWPLRRLWPPAPPLALLGPTASGKSTLALALALLRPEAELVSVDSMAVYRGMDIGTAKPSAYERDGSRTT